VQTAKRASDPNLAAIMPEPDCAKKPHVLKGRGPVLLVWENKMPQQNGNGSSLWGSRANGPFGWTVSVVSVLMLIVVVYMYATSGAPRSPPNATGGSSNQSPARLSTPNK
jgi:hypothetical protein